MKYFFLFFCFFSLLILPSCTQKEEDSVDKRIVKEDTFTEEPLVLDFFGYIQEKPLSLQSSSTHFLEREEGSRLELKSSSVALSAYSGKKAFIKGSFEGSVFVVTEVQVEKEEVSYPETMTWDSFLQSGYPYIFEYPEYFQVLLANKTVFLREKRTDADMIKILSFPKNVPLSSLSEGDFSEVLIKEKTFFQFQAEEGAGFLRELPSSIVKIQFFDILPDEVVFQFLASFVDTPLSQKNLVECGGEEDPLCEEGYFCSLLKEGKGVCTSLHTSEPQYERYTAPEKTVSLLAPLEEQETGVSVLSEETSTSSQNFLEIIPDIQGTEYQNPHLHFSFVYPKNSWFRSFGAQKGSLWYIEIGKQQIEKIGDGEIFLEVKNGARGLTETETENEYTVLLPRDTETHFQVSGKKEDKLLIQGIAKSIQ